MPNSSINYNPSTQKYQVNFAQKTIETTVTDKGSVIDAWVRDITASSSNGPTPNVVGLDIEWRPHPIRSMSNKTATLQLCIDTKCLIVQLFYVDYIPHSLRDFLSSLDFVFVGVEVADDATKLRTEYGLECGRTEDVRAAAMRRWPYRFRRPGLKDLASEVVGLRMNKTKRVTLSDWQARILTEEQVQYACIDAYASYRLGCAATLTMQKEQSAS
ncbi:hypothetical protein Cgig2_019220 [Carnegiea gigantea]|uniref:3'-5' exonuclease domain-containing protein n=1 Tax=Carnegiea gigantea TaxID=171969 RepID=A0A9Q1GLV2_9CARY|nr:hypothetical protein Cgig2_019220 [Carnegiea gigantea]